MVRVTSMFFWVDHLIAVGDIDSPNVFDDDSEVGRRCESRRNNGRWWSGTSRLLASSSHTNMNRAQENQQAVRAI